MLYEPQLGSAVEVKFFSNGGCRTHTEYISEEETNFKLELKELAHVADSTILAREKANVSKTQAKLKMQKRRFLAESGHALFLQCTKKGHRSFCQNALY